LSKAFGVIQAETWEMINHLLAVQVCFFLFS